MMNRREFLTKCGISIFLSIAIGAVVQASIIHSTIGAKETSLTAKGEKPFPRSYCIVRIPFDNYDFRVSFAGKNIKIDWGDGTKGTYASTPAQHTFSAGEYDIEIDSNCTRFESPEDYGRKTIIEVGFGPKVTSIADAGYRNATNLVTIACAPSIATAVNYTFLGCSALDWVCDFPVLKIPSNRANFFPLLNHQITHVGQFTVQQYPNPIYQTVMSLSPYDMMDLMPSLTALYYSDIATRNYNIRRASFPVATVIPRDAFYNLPNLYAVYVPSCTKISACITRCSRFMNNNPLRVTHLRLGHLESGYVPDARRILCWDGSENYLGVFMVDMTRVELSDWLTNLSVANFISQSAFTQKAICTDDPEWNEWEEWFVNGMEIEDVPKFPLER